MKHPIITLLTDFGTTDHYVAAMKGVMLSICPQAELVDISHDIAAFSIMEAAYTLAQAWQYFPKGTIHLAVVDPGVGSARRAIVAEAAGHYFVAPDNGVLSMVLDACPHAKVREIRNERYFRPTVSATFQGRDIFAPIAAHLADGLKPAKLGKVIFDTIHGDFVKPTQIGTRRWRGTVLKIDRFGNIISNLEFSKFQRIETSPFILKLGKQTVTQFCSTYSASKLGEIFVLKGSGGYMEVSSNQSSAADRLRAEVGSALELVLSEV